MNVGGDFFSSWLAQGTLTGVLGNMITGIACSIAGKFIPAQETRHWAKDIDRDPGLIHILQTTAAEQANNLQLLGIDEERIKVLLVSPEVESLLRQLFSVRISSTPVDSTLLKIQFRSMLAAFVDKSEDEVTTVSDNLFSALVDACGFAFEKAVQRGMISAHEVQTARRHRLVMDELRSIKTQIESTRKVSQHKSFARILKFEQAYRERVGRHHKYIVPPNLEGAREVPISQLYVASNLISLRATQSKEQSPFSRAQLLSISYRSVILGNPGAGKSTFAHKLCYDLSTHYDERLYAGRKLTPVIVILRDYASKRKMTGCSILDFIESASKSDYQLDVATGAFDYILQNGRALIIFDGLDELLDTQDRISVKKSVEHFADVYPSIPMLITSREVGYEQAPLDAERFEAFRLLPFDDLQIKEYVTKWFSLNTLYSTEEQEKKSTAFLSESVAVPDIRSNPLMLALMCNLYRQDGYIPQNRPDIYGRCADLLFVKWDKTRGIHSRLPFEHHIRPAMDYLAYWIYSDKNLQGGVSEARLTEKAAEYLNQWCFDDPQEGKVAAEEFINFCRGRAWVFSDTGSTQSQALYQFTHRTFLEYFAAEHLVQTYRSPADLASLLHSKIAKREWDIVAQLVYQMKGNRFQGDTDILLSGLLEAAHVSDTEAGWNFLSFASRCLEFMVPTPAIRRRIVRATVTALIEWLKKSTDASPDASRIDEGDAPALQAITALLHCSNENKNTIQDELLLVIEEQIYSSDNAIGSATASLICNLAFLGGDWPSKNERRQNWTQVADRFFQKHENRFHFLAQHSPSLAIDLYFQQRLGILQLLEMHRLSPLFLNKYDVLIQGIHLSIAMLLVRSALSAHRRKQSKSFDDLQTVGQWLPQCPPPWKVARRLSFEPAESWALKPDKGEEQLSLGELTSDHIAGCLFLLAALYERCENKREFSDMLLSHNSTVIHKVKPFWQVRLGLESTDLYATAGELGFSPEQIKLAAGWGHGEISFIYKKRSHVHPGLRHDVGCPVGPDECLSF